jgi:hypothetical protein
MQPCQTETERESLHRDDLRGRYLCERCEDAMTDEVIPAAESPTGEDIVLCRRCRVVGGGGHAAPY